jgi:hypothetical protein
MQTATTSTTAPPATSTETAASTPASPAIRGFSLPSAKVLIGGVYAICVLGLLAVFAGQIAFTDVDPHENQGPIESIVGISVVGTIALALAVGLGSWLVRNPERARTGAVVVGVLSVLSIPFFWAGAPGILGATAAWLGGLTRGARPLAGAARAAAVVGALLALLNVLLTIGGVIVAAVV